MLRWKDIIITCIMKLLISLDITEGACEDDMTYYDGETFMKDLCTMCQCNNGIINCTVETCPDCEQETIAVSVSNQCCPMCQGKIRSHDPLVTLL